MSEYLLVIIMQMGKHLAQKKGDCCIMCFEILIIFFFTKFTVHVHSPETHNKMAR